MALPLPLRLGGASLQLGGVPVPLVHASPPYQIDAQVPWELAGQTQATLVVSDPDFTSPPQTVAVSQASPGIFPFGQKYGEICSSV